FVGGLTYCVLHRGDLVPRYRTDQRLTCRRAIREVAAIPRPNSVLCPLRSLAAIVSRPLDVLPTLRSRIKALAQSLRALCPPRSLFKVLRKGSLAVSTTPPSGYIVQRSV